MEKTLFILQRLTGLLLAPLLITHLFVILYAIRGGLTAGEILSRTQGNVFWSIFYTIFVLLAAIHAPIGLRNVLHEWTSINNRVVNWAMLLFGFLLVALGLRAVMAVSSGWMS